MHRKFLPPLLLALLSFGWSVAAQVHPTSGEVRLRSTNFADRLVRNVGDLGELLPAGNDNELRSATFRVVPGLAGRGISFQSTVNPELYLRHQGFRVKFHRNDGSALFGSDATFEPRAALSRARNAVSYESVNFPGHFLRHCSFHLYIDNNARNNGDCNATPSVFQQDASFIAEVVQSPAQAAAQQAPVPGAFYRLRTQFRGQGECLEGNQSSSSVHNGAAFMDRCQNVSGQLFSFERVGQDTYRIRTQFRGQGECLEGNQSSSSVHNGSAFMDSCQNVSGQLWRLVPANGGFRLQTVFRGEGECLEGNQATSSVHGGNAFMDRCQNVSGQIWLLERVN